MEVSQIDRCPVCGCSEFLKECGYFYCQECQTQCEDIREQFFDEGGNDDDEGDILVGTPFTRKKPKNQKNIKKGDDFTSWEMFNFILRGLVEELILAGAPPALKDTVLQLWTYYLKKLDVAFISKSERILPKAGARHLKADVQLLYGLKKRKLSKIHRVSSVVADLNTTITNLTDWSSMELRKTLKRRTKKALMDKVTEMSLLDTESNYLDQSDILDTSDFDNTCNLDSTPPFSESSSTSRLEHTNAEEEPVEVTDGIQGHTLNVLHTRHDPRVLTKYKLIVLLYLGLIYEGSKIQISDLIRWIREGHLSYNEAVKHLPDTCFIQGRYTSSFHTVEDFPSYGIFLECAGNLAHFLEMVEWQPPDLFELAKKYVQELHLPAIFSDLIVRFGGQMPLSFYKQHGAREIPNYEARVLAILIIILKMLFGLDGKTERQISNASSQLNKFLSQKKSEKQSTMLFVWSEWVKKLMCRDAVLAKYHFPTKHVLSPEAYGNPQSFINYCKKWNDSNAGLREKYNYLDTGALRVKHAALMNIFESVLNKLQDKESSRNEDIDFPQCFTPFSTYIQKVLEKSLEMDKPLLDNSAIKILTQDFSTRDITYLLAPNQVKRTMETEGCSLKIKRKSAQKKCIKFPSREVFKKWTSYKSRCYVTVRECKIRAVYKRNNDRSCSDDNKNDKTIERKRKKSSNCSNSNSSKSKKRRKHGTTSGNSKKRKSFKCVKLYVPCSQYWVHLEDCDEITECEFETQILHRFPFSFSWLLAECSLISEMSKFTIYKEILRYETLIKNKLKLCKSV